MTVKLLTPSGGACILSPTNTAVDATITVPASTTTMVGTDTTQTLTNKTLTTPNINSAQVATVSGTAPLYMCRAWVNFNGTGTVAIRASGNVSSITDNGTGNYTVNFTTAMPDASYVATGMGSAVTTDSRLLVEANTTRTVSAYRFVTANGAGAAGDAEFANAAFFR